VLKNGKRPHSADEIRAALREWAYAARIQGDDLPEKHKAVIVWLEENTVDMTAFEDDQSGPALARGILEALSRKQDAPLPPRTTPTGAAPQSTSSLGTPPRFGCSEQTH
jgi:hypothetical protein